MLPKITNFKLALGFLCSWTHVPFPFFHSFVLMKRPEFIPIFATNGPVDGLRNQIVARAMRLGVSHLIMLDLDQTYPAETIAKLLEHKLPLIGCKVHRRYPPFDPIMMKGDINTYTAVHDWEESTLQEVDATGTGCLLFDMQLFYELDEKALAENEAFNKLKPSSAQMAAMSNNTQKYMGELEKRYVPENAPGKWFKFRPNPDPERSGVVGEDMGFCSDVRKMGHKIYVDTSIKCGHLSTMEITEETYFLYRALKKKQAQADKEKLS